MSLTSSNGLQPVLQDRPSDGFHLYLAGVGSVGRALLNHLSGSTREEPDRPSLRLVGACTSQRAVWDSSGIEPSAVRSRLAEAPPLDWAQVMQHVNHDAPRPLLVVDATGSPEVASLYEDLFRAGVHVVTPSKLANTRSQATFDRLRTTARRHEVEYRYETTVGAGLPVVQTVNDLVQTGDRLRSLRGAVSGTLTYIFSTLRDGTAFSDAVTDAIDRGYAEPDIRDDLSGEDVARKFLILARTAGISISRSDVNVESLVPASLSEGPLDHFLEHLPALDDRWEERSRAAADEDRVLQYLGCFTGDGIDVGIEAVPRSSAFGRLDGQDNLFEITTDRYAASPLTIRGPGAGPAVTAAGVLADVQKVVRSAAATRTSHETAA